MSNHYQDIIEDKLSLSYESESHWFDGEGSSKGMRHEPEAAVLLLTRCCPINHEHISLTKEQGEELYHWLDGLINGEYDD